MNSYRAQLLMSGFVTHDVHRYIFTRPEGFCFKPGQGTEIAVAAEDSRDARRPFTPTSLPDEAALEFTIKSYPEHHGLTARLARLEPGTEFVLTPAFGTITYRGPGTFIAGGAGITPMLAIVRQLAREGTLSGHRMLFSNKTPADIICEKELRHYFGSDLVLTCTRESGPGYLDRRIDQDLLSKHVADFGQHLYVCGPPAFVKNITSVLERLGAEPETLIFED